MSVNDIDFKTGYSASYYVSFVDKNSWVDFERMNITGGSINRDNNDALMESADISCVNYPESPERLVRIYMDIRQGNSVGHIPLFTGWATSPERSIKGRLTTNTLQCYSVLKPSQDILLPPGWYVPVETDSRRLIEELLKPTGAPIIFANEMASLKNALIAEENENNLSMAELILDSVGCNMQIRGDGMIFIYERQSANQADISRTFDYIDNDILETQVTVKRDWYDCPNVFRAIVDDSYAIARDDDPESIFSTVQRGREIWAQETDCDLLDNESPSEYAARRLEELQTVYRTINYTRRYQPDLYPLDFVRIHYPAQDISGIFQIASQTINLGYNASTSEEAIQVG